MDFQAKIEKDVSGLQDKNRTIFALPQIIYCYQLRGLRAPRQVSRPLLLSLDTREISFIIGITAALVFCKLRVGAKWARHLGALRGVEVAYVFRGDDLFR